MAGQVYSPADVDISVGGVNIDGWDSITVTKSVENTSKNISADGKVGLTWSADPTGSVEIEVQQQAAGVNRYFIALQAGQSVLKQPYYLNITISDKSGGVLCKLTDCFLDMPADQAVAAEAGSRTWNFFVTDLSYVPDIGVEGLGDAISAISSAASVFSSVKNLVG